MLSTDTTTSLGTVMELKMFSEASLPSSIIFELWDDFSYQRKNAGQLLKQCAHLNGPCKAFVQPRD